MIKKDFFKVGDKVTWRDEHYADHTVHFSRATLGDGPFTVIKVVDVPYQSYAEYHDFDPEFGGSNHKSMGHTQFVTIAEWKNEVSGAFFKVVP